MSGFRDYFGGLFSAKKPAQVERSPESVIEYYRQFGFFEGTSTEEVLAKRREEWGEVKEMKSIWDEVFLLGYDDNRAWASDPEADVCEGNMVYTQLLPQWGRISGGAFSPDNIEEKWQTEAGPIEISFTLNGAPAAIHPKYQDDWVDLEILLELNALLNESGKRFNVAVDGNFCLLVFLDTAHEKRWRRERGFPFALP